MTLKFMETIYVTFKDVEMKFMKLMEMTYMKLTQANIKRM